MSDHFMFEVLPNPTAMPPVQRQKLMVDPSFGTVFSDHMVTIRWQPEKGWHNGQVRARAPFLIDPAAAVLHYAQEIFEGMKAYRATDGRLLLFRPEKNAERFARSASRLAMPEVPPELFVEAVKQLVLIDREWIPDGDGSLYIRPFMFSDEPFLGVRPANDYIFCVIACPVGAYFKGGPKPLRLWVSEDFSRAAPGGTGDAKCGGNYAASLAAQSEAIRKGCDQVVFLDAVEHRWIEELGGMNLFFAMSDGTLVTPPLGGTILPGIIRSSILTLASEKGMRVSEQPYSLSDWRADAASGRLREAFACGTAAVVAGVGRVDALSGGFQIGDGSVGPLTLELRDSLISVQRGMQADHHGWIVGVG